MQAVSRLLILAVPRSPLDPNQTSFDILGFYETGFGPLEFGVFRIAGGILSLVLRWRGEDPNLPTGQTSPPRMERLKLIAVLATLSALMFLIWVLPPGTDNVSGVAARSKRVIQ